MVSEEVKEVQEQQLVQMERDTSSDLLRIVKNNQKMNESITKDKIRTFVRSQEKRILIVDDEPYNLMAAKILLEVLGLQDSGRVIETAVNGQIAFEKIQHEIQIHNKNRYDLIFMDQNMPVMDGCQAAQKIRHFLYDMNQLQPLIIGTSGQTE